MWLVKKNGYLGLVTFALATSSFSYTGHTVFTAAGGISQANFSNAHLTVSSLENDSLHQKNHDTALISSLGLGYDYVRCPGDCSSIVHDVLVGLNFYNVNLENAGTVYQFGDSSLNNFKYKMPIETTRLMLDVKISADEWHHVSPFLLMGAGMSWNRVNYHDSAVVSGVTPVSLTRNEQLKFAYEAGLGIQSTLTSSISVFIEYLYADLGRVKTSSFGSVSLVSPASTSIQVNSGLIGLNYSF